PCATAHGEGQGARIIPQGPWHGAVGSRPRRGGDGKCPAMAWTRGHEVAPAGLGSRGLAPTAVRLGPVGAKALLLLPNENRVESRVWGLKSGVRAGWSASPSSVLC